MKLSKKIRTTLLIYAIIAFFGPNALYVYVTITNPSVNMEALNNPVALVFMIEAMMLLSLFTIYVYKKTHSSSEALKYVILSFVGSLAFSFPLFLYLNSNKEN
jgi:multisubunit Na+/H+ antiporter MnhF subunit